MIVRSHGMFLDQRIAMDNNNYDNNNSNNNEKIKFSEFLKLKTTNRHSQMIMTIINSFLQVRHQVKVGCH